MADYRRMHGLKSPVGWLPVHRDQLRAQCSETSMGKLYVLRIEMHNHASASSTIDNRVTLNFDHLTIWPLHMSTMFGVDSSKRFPFVAWTHRHTESQIPLITQFTYGSANAGVGSYNARRIHNGKATV